MRNQRLPGRGDELAEKSGHFFLRGSPGEIKRKSLEQELYRPAAHHGIITENQERRQDGEQSYPLPGRSGGQFAHSAKGVQAAAAADDGFGKEDGQCHQQAGGDIHQDEGGAAIFAQDIGKTPDVPQSHGAARHSGDHCKAVAEMFPLFHHSRTDAITKARMPNGAT